MTSWRHPSKAFSQVLFPRQLDLGSENKMETLIFSKGRTPAWWMCPWWDEKISTCVCVCMCVCARVWVLYGCEWGMRVMYELERERERKIVRHKKANYKGYEDNTCVHTWTRVRERERERDREGETWRRKQTILQANVRIGERERKKEWERQRQWESEKNVRDECCWCR